MNILNNYNAKLLKRSVLETGSAYIKQRWTSSGVHLGDETSSHLILVLGREESTWERRWCSHRKGALGGSDQVNPSSTGICLYFSEVLQLRVWLEIIFCQVQDPEPAVSVCMTQDSTCIECSPEESSHGEVKHKSLNHKCHSGLSGQLWLILFCFTLRKLQLSISWNNSCSLCNLINQVTQLTHHSIKNNYIRQGAGNAKTGAQNCSHAAQAVLQSMAQRLRSHHCGRVKNTYHQGRILVGLGSQTWKSAFPRMPHTLLACGPENNSEKHRRRDNDTVMWQGLQRARWVWSGCKSKGGEIYPHTGGQSSQDSWLVVPEWQFRGSLKSECQC